MRRVLTRTFAREAERAFRDAYFAVTGDAPSLDMRRETRKRVLDLYLLEKAAYEIGYEARNRPTWLEIAVSGFSDIVSDLTEEEA